MTEAPLKQGKASRCSLLAVLLPLAEVWATAPPLPCLQERFVPGKWLQNDCCCVCRMFSKWVPEISMMAAHCIGSTVCLTLQQGLTSPGTAGISAVTPGRTGSGGTAWISVLSSPSTNKHPLLAGARTREGFSHCRNTVKLWRFRRPFPSDRSLHYRSTPRIRVP